MNEFEVLGEETGVDEDTQTPVSEQEIPETTN